MTGPPPPGPERRALWRRRKARGEARERSRRRVRRLVGVLLGASRLLPYPVAMAAGEAAGIAAWAFAGRARRWALEHLDGALGGELSPAARRRVVRRVFLQLGRAAAEVLVARNRGVEFFERRLEGIDNFEVLEAAVARGRGVIAVTGHFGNFELLAAFMARRADLKVVGRAAKPGDATGLVEEMRKGFGMETLSQFNPRGILRALRGGSVVGILPDQDLDRLDGIFVPFFGRPAYTPTGPASLCLATGAALVPLFIRRVGRGRHRIVFHPEIPLDPSAPDREAEVERATRAWTRALEEEIRARPDHWVWFHRRWQTTPERLKEVRERRARAERERLERKDRRAGR